MHTHTPPQTQPAPDIEPPAPDKYDAAVEYLTTHPDEIQEAWMEPVEHQAGCLFMHVNGLSDIDNYGCLTQVKLGTHRAKTSELTRLIRADYRIPSFFSDITVDDLPVFAGWQRRIDDALGRT